MLISEVINTNAVVLDLEAVNKTEVLNCLTELLFDDDSIDSKDKFFI